MPTRRSRSAAPGGRRGCPRGARAPGWSCCPALADAARAERIVSVTARCSRSAMRAHQVAPTGGPARPVRATATVTGSRRTRRRLLPVGEGAEAGVEGRGGPCCCTTIRRRRVEGDGAAVVGDASQNVGAIDHAAGRCGAPAAGDDGPDTATMHTGPRRGPTTKSPSRSACTRRRYAVAPASPRWWTSRCRARVDLGRS